MVLNKLAKLRAIVLISITQLLVIELAAGQVAWALGVVVPMASKGPPAGVCCQKASRAARIFRQGKNTKPVTRTFAGSLKKRHLRKKSKVASKRAAFIRPPQELTSFLVDRALVPGVVHKTYRNVLTINVLDVDLLKASVKIRTVLAGQAFNCLDEVKDQAARAGALAAVNANYFKKNGIPLGTLMIDGEWVAGPLYDRISLGITKDKQVLIDHLNLHGMLETSNPEVACDLWVNNINQPRRNGSRLIVYTRRWGSFVHVDYPGSLVAVSSQGQVVSKSAQNIYIPPGGFVLSDSKASEIAKLVLGDQVKLTWYTRPNTWQKVVHAISGGPELIRNGKLYVDLVGENFRTSWASKKIKARTAVGVTAHHHLILATIEGPHSLWEMAKFLHKLGCVRALNLDGGGSTTMVVNGATATINKNVHERRVANCLAIITDNEPSISANGLSDLGVEIEANASPAPNFLPATDYQVFVGN